MAFELIDELQASPQKQEGFAAGTARTFASGLTSLYALAAGTPGNIFSLFNLAVKPISEAITGKEGLPYEETLLGKALPTTSKVEQDIYEKFPYLKSKDDFQKWGNDVLKTGTSFLIPGGQAQKGLIRGMNPITRAFTKAIAAKSTGELTKGLTGDEDKGSLAETGSLILMSMLDRQSAGRAVGAVYERARDALTRAGNPNMVAPELRNSLQNLATNLRRGIVAPSEAPVLGDVETILGHFNGNEIPVENTWASLRGINERIQRLRREAGSAQERQNIDRLYGNVNHLLNRELTRYGRANPEFGVPFQEAQQAHGAIQRSNLISRFIDKVSQGKLPPQLAHIFGGIGQAVASGAAGFVSPLSAALPPVYQASKIMYRITQSPMLRRHYLNVLQGAARESAPKVLENLGKLERELNQEESKNQKYTLID